MRSKWECYTDRAQYIKKQEQAVTIVIETDLNEPLDRNEVRIKICRLSDVVKELFDISWEIVNNKRCARINTGIWGVGGYGAEVYYGSLLVAATAFDVVTDFKDNPRYGFLSEFAKRDEEAEDVLYANKLHLNMLQFYDWMYRHDKLISTRKYYKNPLGREISEKAIRMKIEACRRYGIRPYAYGAVYAAGKDFYENHKEWAMYKLDKEPIMFADWLVYMNIAEGSGWSSYIKGQFREAVARFKFSGIHMDTYGYPKSGRDYEGNGLKLSNAFSKLINQTRKEVQEVDPEAGVIFNAVNDWPVETVALAEQDGVYIEVWPPHDTYRDLYLLIRKARAISGKQVILAAYMKPFASAKGDEDDRKAEHACILAFAAIHASGGHQLIFGENGGILREGYYVNYAHLRDDFLPVVRAYSDFIVRYSELLYSKASTDISMTFSDGINEDICFSCPDSGIGFSSCAQANKVWCLINEAGRRITISLINLIGTDDRWNEGKSGIITGVSDIKIRLLLENRINGIYYSTPDDPYCRVHKLEYRTERGKKGSCVEVIVPSLLVWDYIWIDFP